MTTTSGTSWGASFGLLAPALARAAERRDSRSSIASARVCDVLRTHLSTWQRNKIGERKTVKPT